MMKKEIRTRLYYLKHTFNEIIRYYNFNKDVMKETAKEEMMKTYKKNLLELVNNNLKW